MDTRVRGEGSGETGAEAVMLGDPMEMIGKDYAQFLFERESPHASPEKISRSGMGPRVVLWVIPEPISLANVGRGFVRCCFYEVAPECHARFRFPADGQDPCLVCTCQGNLIE